MYEHTITQGSFSKTCVTVGIQAKTKSKMMPFYELKKMMLYKFNIMAISKKFSVSACIVTTVISAISTSCRKDIQVSSN